MAGPGTSFAQLGRQARAWLAAPSEQTMHAVCNGARAASDLVPQARRQDWERLILSLMDGGPAERQRARVQGLVRACRLFAPKKDGGEGPRASRGVLVS